ncbi:MAG TPA: hypothetical protein VFM01_15135, partial [Nakamurella sp.]|nr:hypothetical protein [Nakamurella sp.]
MNGRGMRGGGDGAAYSAVDAARCAGLPDRTKGDASLSRGLRPGGDRNSGDGPRGDGLPSGGNRTNGDASDGRGFQSDGDRTNGDGSRGGGPLPGGAATAVAGGVTGAEGGGGAAATVRGGLAAIRRVLVELRDLPWWTLSQAELLDTTREVESTLRGGFGVQVRLAGELHERGVADMLDARSAAHVLHQTLHITMSDARARVAAAAAALPCETPTGSVIGPAAPELLAAVDAGAVSAG